MRRRSWRVMAALCVVTAWPHTVSAQAIPDCQVNLDRVGGVGQRVEPIPGQIRYYASGGVSWSCIARPGTRDAGRVVWSVRSDSVANFVSLGRMEFVDRVEFQDSTARLTADRATYFERVDSLEARGHVNLVNLVTGTVLTGPQLTYLREVEGVRDTAELRASLRPTIEYRAQNDTAEPYLIVADRVRLRGNSTWAAGKVTIDRSDFASRGDSAWLDLDGGHGLLVGNAQASGKDSLSYVLQGDRLAFGLVDDKLEWVEAQGNARATSAEWNIVGDTVLFSVQDDMIQGGSAWGEVTRPRATSESYSIVADSLAVDTPGQQLTEVRGFGNALASTAADTLEADPDWMAGDTVIAHFETGESGGRTLTELVAAGNARAFYKIVDQADSTAVAAINYSRGLKIIAQFKNETVDRVDVVGMADGVYLEPKRIPPP